nr:putative ribonuclease H-like domain-containing protein [Tanacetum cinerariifolium]
MAFSSSSSSSDNEVFARAMFDCDDYLSSESDESWPPSSLYDRFQPSDRPTAPIIEDWVSESEDESETKASQIVPSFVQSSKQVKYPRHSIQHVKTSILAATPKPASLKSASSGKRRNRKACFVCKSVDHLIKDFFTQSKPISITAVRPVSADVPKFKVTRPRYAHPIVTKSKSPIRRHITRSPSQKTSNSPPRVTAVQAIVVLFSVSQMCDKKNSVLFTDTECLVLSPDFKLPNENFKLPDASQVLLRVLRENNMYNVNLKNIIPSGDLTCLFVKATLDESNLWHRRLGHVNFKTINKLVKGNLVRGLPSKVFTNDLTCVACKKGKQQRASCKSKTVSSVDQPLFRLHMDLFGPTFVKSLSKKSYCLVVTDDYSRFSWVFFLATKDETASVLKTFIVGLENLLSLKVKIIRCDNGTEFKNVDLNQFCGLKGIKGEFSVPRTPQQNGIAKRKNKTLIEASRTMLADSLLPIPFWAEEVNTACYVYNRVLVTKPHNKTLYALLHGSGPIWLFDIDSLTRTMNYQPVTLGNQTNLSAGFRAKFVAEKTEEEIDQQYVLFPVWSSGFTNPQNNDGDAAFDGKEPDFDAKKPESEFNISPSSKLEDITYSDDENVVGAEADFNNLETSI